MYVAGEIADNNNNNDDRWTGRSLYPLRVRMHGVIIIADEYMSCVQVYVILEDL